MSDFDIARENMVHNQLMANNVVEEHILEAFRLVPKEIFLPLEKKPKAYIDEDIKIMNDRYLIEPRVMANIIKLSGIKKNHIIMDLVCSTGYTSAILSKLSKKVYGIDNKEDLIQEANLNIKKLNINNVNFLNKNPIIGIKKKFDIIYIFGGVEYIPIHLLDSLKNDGGSLVTVLYDNAQIGKIHIVKKINGKISKKNFITAQTPILKEFQRTTKEFIF
tara:strand:- start:1668 stop:2324 length:657 start_codon:yes stop_codon:yes gene_type:complete